MTPSKPSQKDFLDPNSFVSWVKKLDKSEKPIPHLLYAFDPGETTGFAIFRDGELEEAKQLPTHNIYAGVNILNGIIEEEAPDFIVYEDYRVYDWKAKDHSWGTLHTPRLIGGLQTLCHLKGIPRYCHMAQQPKAFVTDDKLRQWDYYRRGQRHARDAIRHGCFYLLFNNGKYHDEHNFNL